MMPTYSQSVAQSISPARPWSGYAIASHLYSQVAVVHCCRIGMSGEISGDDRLFPYVNCFFRPGKGWAVISVY